MALKTAYGNIRSVKIFFNDKKGEIILRTEQPPGSGMIAYLTLILTNDNVSTFAAMAAVAGTATEFGNVSNPGSNPHVHVEYEDTTKEISWLQFHYHLFLEPPPVLSNP